MQRECNDTAATSATWARVAADQVVCNASRHVLVAD